MATADRRLPHPGLPHARMPPLHVGDAETSDGHRRDGSDSILAMRLSSPHRVDSAQTGWLTSRHAIGTSVTVRPAAFDGGPDSSVAVARCAPRFVPRRARQI
jgi:hypothetical protein